MEDVISMTNKHTIKDLPEGYYRDWADLGILDMVYNPDSVLFVLEKATLQVSKVDGGLDVKLREI